MRQWLSHLPEELDQEAEVSYSSAVCDGRADAPAGHIFRKKQQYYFETLQYSIIFFHLSS
jgi:hypothetical protein